MTTLHEIIALAKGKRSSVEKRLNTKYHDLQRAALFVGLSRTYEPLNDDDGERLPPERQIVQRSAPDMLADIAGLLTETWDLTLTRDAANQDARADVIVDDIILIPDAPVSFLLFLEKELADWRSVLSKAPVLSADRQWHFDENQGVFRTDPVKTLRTQKVRKAHVLYEATDRHPAQVESYTEDVPVGTWSATHFSSALTANAVHVLLDRLDKLEQAVRAAREQANTMTVTDVRAFKDVFDYLLGR